MNNQILDTPKIVAPNEPHLACVLLVDTSGSMYGEPLNSLNIALQKFRTHVIMDEMSKKRVDVAVVEFNQKAYVVQPFTPIFHMKPKVLSAAAAATAMGEGINMALDMVKERNRFYKKLGTPAFKPWIFMITDGTPTDDIEPAVQRIQEEEDKGKLKFFALGIGKYDKTTMFKLTNRVMELRYTDFTGIYDWMSESMVTISVSRVGEEAKLPNLPQDARKADPDRDVRDW
jgi:uncharacterized protein YegL